MVSVVTMPKYLLHFLSARTDMTARSPDIDLQMKKSNRGKYLIPAVLIVKPELSYFGFSDQDSELIIGEA